MLCLVAPFSCLGLCSDLVGKSQFRYSAVSFSITLLPKYFALTVRMSGIRCLFTLSGFVEQIKSWKAVGLQASRVCTKDAGSQCFFSSTTVGKQTVFIC